MDIIMWVVAGGVIGWVALAYLGVNEERGLNVSGIIGAVGGIIGGKLLAPMFGAGAAVPGEFSLMVLIIVLASAAVCVAIANQIHNRFGV